MLQNDPTTQHTISAAAIAVPAYSQLAHWPEMLTVILSVLGIVWYLIQIGSWVARKLK